jgi:hypothetical protein
VDVVAHRLVHGGAELTAPTVVDDRVRAPTGVLNRTTIRDVPQTPEPLRQKVAWVSTLSTYQSAWSSQAKSAARRITARRPPGGGCRRDDRSEVARLTILNERCQDCTRSHSPLRAEDALGTT